MAFKMGTLVRFNPGVMVAAEECGPRISHSSLLLLPPKTSLKRTELWCRACKLNCRRINIPADEIRHDRWFP